MKLMDSTHNMDIGKDQIKFDIGNNVPELTIDIPIRFE